MEGDDYDPAPTDVTNVFADSAENKGIARRVSNFHDLEKDFAADEVGPGSPFDVANVSPVAKDPGDGSFTFFTPHGDKSGLADELRTEDNPREAQFSQTGLREHAQSTVE